jgi:hypothetical protein
LNFELLYDLSLIKEVPQFKIENLKFKITPCIMRRVLRLALPEGRRGLNRFDSAAKPSIGKSDLDFGADCHGGGGSQDVSF